MRGHTSGIQPGPIRSRERVLYVGEDILVATWRALRDFSRRRCEGTVRWAGPAFQAKCRFQIVTTVVVPFQRVGPGLFEVPHEATRAMGDALVADYLVNLAQLHTHPDSSVCHSSWDDERAYSSRDGALSIVWPHYGKVLAPMGLWGVHESRARTWVRLADAEAARRIVVVPSLRDLRHAVEVLDQIGTVEGIEAGRHGASRSGEFIDQGTTQTRKGRDVPAED